jgi:hypothetical protein
VSTAINTDADDTKKNDNAKDNDDEISFLLLLPHVQGQEGL